MGIEQPAAHAHVIAARDGLRLRALPALLTHADDAEVERGLSHRFPHPYTRADGEAFLRGELVPLADAFAIELDGEAVGGIGLQRLPGDRAIGAELGYWLGRAYWGRGLMSDVVATSLCRGRWPNTACCGCRPPCWASMWARRGYYKTTVLLKKA